MIQEEGFDSRVRERVITMREIALKVLLQPSFPKAALAPFVAPLLLVITPNHPEDLDEAIHGE